MSNRPNIPKSTGSHSKMTPEDVMKKASKEIYAHGIDLQQGMNALYLMQRTLSAVNREGKKYPGQEEKVQAGINKLVEDYYLPSALHMLAIHLHHSSKYTGYKLDNRNTLPVLNDQQMGTLNLALYQERITMGGIGGYPPGQTIPLDTWLEAQSLTFTALDTECRRRAHSMEMEFRPGRQEEVTKALLEIAAGTYAFAEQELGAEKVHEIRFTDNRASKAGGHKKHVLTPDERALDSVVKMINSPTMRYENRIGNLDTMLTIINKEEGEKKAELVADYFLPALVHIARRTGIALGDAVYDDERLKPVVIQARPGAKTLSPDMQEYIEKVSHAVAFSAIPDPAKSETWTEWTKQSLDTAKEDAFHDDRDSARKHVTDMLVNSYILVDSLLGKEKATAALSGGTGDLPPL